jgi:vesicle-associated membrane protein-associated protein A
MSEFSHVAPALAPIPVSAAITESPNTELLAKYNAAQVEIERLRAAIEIMAASPPDELRRRNRTSSDDGASVAETDAATVLEDNHYHPQDGVPLQLVVIIALGVFITTYLFF